MQRRDFVVLVTVLLVASVVGSLQAFPSEPQVRQLFMAGDSTLDEHKYPGEKNTKGFASWGACLAPYLKDGVTIVNYARAGFSTLRFMSVDPARGNNNWWERIVSEAKRGDFAFIQFGHNDQKIMTTETYKGYLRQMVSDVTGKQAVPVLVTPIVRLTFEDGILIDNSVTNPKIHAKASLDAFAQAMCEVAAETKTELVDLRALTRKAAQNAGEEEALTWTISDPTDTTHPGEKGAKLFALLFRDYVKSTNLKTAELFKSDE